MTDKRQKGTYGAGGIPVSKEYILPAARRLIPGIGALLLLVLIGFVVYDVVMGPQAFFSNGPLSSNHANLEGECSACHVDSQVANPQCESCHERYGDEVGVYSYTSHYLYRTGDFQRVKPSPEEAPCFSCHPEHNGRGAALTVVSDSHCVDCHDYGSFNGSHPQFAALEKPDDASLKFTHIHHVREVMSKAKLEDVEKACMYCHNPAEDGKGFQALSFDRHCDACHLTSTTGTPRLPIAKDGNLGVQTLSEILAKGEPGSRWALFTDPGAFREAGGRLVSKSPLFHRDPWVLENLRDLRKMLYPNAGLADLLTTSPDAPAHELRTLYREAVATLEGYALELRNRPEKAVQDELEKIEKALKAVKRALDDPYLALDETEFILSLDEPNADLAEEQVGEIQNLIMELTEACRQCHVVEKGTIARVNPKQETYRRAEFNHRAHIIQRRCLDCHSRIPINDFLGNEEKPDPSIDRAAILNLPGIETCQDCHNAAQASRDCMTCHVFHPDQDRRSHLLLYLD